MAHSKYERIAGDLRAAIASGELAEGSPLPTIAELMSRYSTSDRTVRSAIAELRAAGLIVSQQGKPATVRIFRTIRRNSPARLAREQWGAGQAIQDADTESRARVVDVVVAEEPAPDWVASPLELTPGAQALSRDRRFLVEDRPVQLAKSFFDADLVRGTGIAHTNTGPGGSYARLADLGHEPTQFTEYVRSRQPTPAELRRLELSPGGTVLEITRHAFTEAGKCVEVNRMILDGTVYILGYSFPA